MFHYVLEDHYLKRNPHVLYPDPKVPVSIKPGAAEVFPISKPLPRFNSPQALNHFTSACSTIIYRDTLFGKEFEGNMFVSEPGHELGRIYRVYPEGKKPREIPVLDTIPTKDLAKQLESPNGWTRDAIQQILIGHVWRQVDFDIVSKALKEIATKGASPQARLHA